MKSNQEKFIRILDKSQIPTCTILNVKIAAIDMKWLLDYTKENIKKFNDYQGKLNNESVAKVEDTYNINVDFEFQSFIINRLSFNFHSTDFNVFNDFSMISI